MRRGGWGSKVVSNFSENLSVLVARPVPIQRHHHSSCRHCQSSFILKLNWENCDQNGTLYLSGIVSWGMIPCGQVTIINRIRIWMETDYYSFSKCNIMFRNHLLGATLLFFSILQSIKKGQSYDKFEYNSPQANRPSVYTNVGYFRWTQYWKYKNIYTTNQHIFDFTLNNNSSE